MTSTPAPPSRGRSRRLIALLIVFAMAAFGLGIGSAVAAVDQPILRSAPGTSTALQVSWGAIKDAQSYRVQYATNSGFKGAATLPASGQPAITKTSTTITGLRVDQTYYVRFAALDANGKAGQFSVVSTGTPRYPYEAPGDLVRTKITKNSMTVSWAAVKGAPGYELRAYSKGHPTKYFRSTAPSVNLTGLQASTNYYLRAYVFTSDPKTNKPTKLSPDSLEVQTSTSGYTLAAPDRLQETTQGPSSVGLSWTAVTGAPRDGGYQVTYARNAALTDTAQTTKTVSGTSGTISGLRADTTYFAAVFVVDKGGKRISNSSDFVVAKSVVPRGRISGQVSGVSGSDLTAAAYDSAGNVARAVTVGADNSYNLDVRPGTYRVQLMYTGTGNYASAWAKSGSDGGWTITQASPIGVSLNKTTGAPKVQIRRGHAVTGTVVDPGGRPVRDVDLTAITGSTAEREVIALAASGSDGKFTLQGLGTGTYWLRAVYARDGFKTASLKVKVKQDLGVRVNLANENFRSQYKAYINGSRKVGSTLSVHATPWLAGSYPTTYASMSYQWKRNGAAIKGATASRYKLGKADKGKPITITVTARRYGYNTGSATSKSVKIS